MSAKASGIVWESDLPRPEKYVLLALADHAKEDGSDVYPSLSRVEWKTGYSETQVRDIMNSLRKKGILVMVHQGGKGPEDTHEYRIDLKSLSPLPEFKTWKAEKMGTENTPLRVRKLDPSKGAVSPEKGCGLPSEKGTKTEPEPRTTRTNTVIEPTTSCAEASSALPVILLPLNDQTEHGVLIADLDELVRLYPAANVEQELRNMRGWLLTHANRRKTRRGIGAFITNWLSKVQDTSPRAYTNGNGTYKRAGQQRATDNVEALLLSSMGEGLQRNHVPDSGPIRPGVVGQARRQDGPLANGEVMARGTAASKP